MFKNPRELLISILAIPVVLGVLLGAIAYPQYVPDVLKVVVGAALILYLQGMKALFREQHTTAYRVGWLILTGSVLLLLTNFAFFPQPPHGSMATRILSGAYLVGLLVLIFASRKEKTSGTSQVAAG